MRTGAGVQMVMYGGNKNFGTHKIFTDWGKQNPNDDENTHDCGRMGWR